MSERTSAATAEPAERRVVAHTREFLADSVTPLGAYRRLGAISPVRFLFESVTGGEQVSRYSFLGAAPRRTCRLFEDRLEVVAGGERQVRRGDPLGALRAELRHARGAHGEVPFLGGWVGYFGYDVVRLLEHLPNRPPQADELPLAVLARFDRVVVFDHARQRLLAVSSEIEGEVSRGEAERELDRLTDLLTSAVEGGAVPMPGSAESGAAAKKAPVRVSLDSDAYRQAVRKAQEHIAAGDIFQAVLARRFSVDEGCEPMTLYRALRSVNPSPYMVLLELEDVALVGASPEMLVRKTGARVENRPIAGTRPRSSDPQADDALAAELLADEKERAEHVMLVDLGRNDVGRIALPGSVTVPQFMEIERYSHVMHIVSRVEGELDPRYDALDALLACFPAGTVSGAPKIRAMEIVDELEPVARGPYAGAVGYLSFSGDLDTCITLRTLVVREDEVSVTAGAGIVADSDPDAEVLETENKAAALLAAVELARGLGSDDGEAR